MIGTGEIVVFMLNRKGACVEAGRAVGQAMTAVLCCVGVSWLSSIRKALGEMRHVVCQSRDETRWIHT